MRELIKAGNYLFSNDSRQITITDGRDFSADDILLIINETKKIIITSAMNKDLISVTDNIITYSNSIPALKTGDVLNIQIDFPQRVANMPTHIQSYNFTTTTGTISIHQSGNLISFTDVTAMYIRRVGSDSFNPFSLPSYVNEGDIIVATVLSVGNKNIVIEKQDSSENIISIGNLEPKIINGCSNFSYYSQFLSKIIVGGLSVFSEDGMHINGDGYGGFSNTYAAESAYNQHYIEHNGYLFYYSIERNSLIRLNLQDGSVFNIGLNVEPVKMYIIGDYLYLDGRRSIRVIPTNLTGVPTSIVSQAYTNGNAISGISISDGTSMFFMVNNTYLAKFTGLTYTVGTVGTSLNYQEYLTHAGDFIYGMNNEVLRKYNKSDCNLVAAIGIPTACNTIFTNSDNSKIYVISASGRMYRVDVSTFTYDNYYIDIGISKTMYLSCIENTGKMYMFAGNNAGSDLARTFAVFDLSTEAITIHSNVLSLNTHNAMNIDPVNNRLIFYAIGRSTTIQSTNVEIINIP